MVIRQFTPLAFIAALLISAGCQPTQPSPSPTPASNTTSGAGTTEVAEEYVGDTSVSAEDGGPGFTGEGWETAEPRPLGDPRALKGGSILSAIYAWPDNIRVYGTASNTWLNYLARELCYERLLVEDPNTLEFVPALASHWKISDDNMTFTFRINPKARWSDGKPVTSEDVVATYRLLNDDTLADPMMKAAICEKMNEPVAKSKYIVEVTCKQKHWRNFISCISLFILPAHQIGDITGEEYLDKFNFEYTATSGPYTIRPEDLKTDESITLTRRKDYWAADSPFYVGMNNFDRIRFAVVRDHRLAFDKAVKGELDYNYIWTSSWWVEDLDPEKVASVKNGLLVRRKIYTKFPKGFQGEGFNMRLPIFEDVRVRKALAHLYDRKTLLEKFMYNEYEPLKSYFPGSDGECPKNELVEYDPRLASELLAEAGWKERGADGILLKDGKRFSVTLQYGTPGFEKYLTIFQEECKKVGVELKLQLLDRELRWTNAMEQKFEFTSQPWGAILFPNPRTNFHSDMADKTGSNNFVGLKSEVVDSLIEQYDEEFDLAARNEILREIDSEVFNSHPYVLDWYNPAERVIYWNKFGMPETGLRKYDEWEDAFSLWWVDPEKAKQLKEAKRSGGTMPLTEMNVRPWD